MSYQDIACKRQGAQCSLLETFNYFPFTYNNTFIIRICGQQSLKLQMGHAMRKRVLCHMRPTKVQISLRIRTV